MHPNCFVLQYGYLQDPPGVDLVDVETSATGAEVQEVKHKKKAILSDKISFLIFQCRKHTRVSRGRLPWFAVSSVGHKEEGVSRRKIQSSTQVRVFFEREIRDDVKDVRTGSGKSRRS